MKLDVNQPITMISGDPFKDENGPLTLKAVVTNSLLTVGPNETLNGSEKIERNGIAEKIFKATEPVELNLSELGKIKNIIEGKNAYPVRIVAEVHRMLESAGN